MPIAIAKQAKSPHITRMSETEVVVVGGGAAGMARRASSPMPACRASCSRRAIGWRLAWTHNVAGYPLDLGCGWLHSADRNRLTKIAREQGKRIDETPPPWQRICKQSGFPIEEQKLFREAQQAFFERIDEMAKQRPEAPSSQALAPDGRWNALISAVTTYIAGAEPERVAMADFASYEDSGVNWRVVEGYGTAIVAHAEGVRVELNTPVQRIDRSGARLRLIKAKGEITAAQVIVTLPSALLAAHEDFLSPALPDKLEAARALPLGLADKLFIALEDAEEFESDSRMYGSPNRVATASYSMRPFGRPMSEVYFGGSHAEALKLACPFFEFAVRELTDLNRESFRKRLNPIGMHRWAADPLARGSYSYAVPGQSGARAASRTVEDRIFFPAKPARWILSLPRMARSSAG